MMKHPSMRALLPALCLVLLAASSAASSEAFVAVEGKIVLPDGMKLPPEAEVQLVLEGGRTMVAFPDAKARFSIARVPAGTHSLYVFTSKFVFPPVKLVVGASAQHPVAAFLPELPGAPAMPYPLLLRPVALAEYFEQRKPFNVIGFLKTPYGMMGAFMVFSMFLLPKLKVDPEEYKRVMGSEGGEGERSGGGSNGGRSRRD